MQLIAKFCPHCKKMPASRWMKSLGQLALQRPLSGIESKKLRAAGVIKRTTVELDAEALGFESCFFVLIRTSEHEADWQSKFLKALKNRPEVLEAHRLAGEIDYILKVVVPNARAYDTFYQALITEVRVFNVTALLSMEELKSGGGLSLEE